jgi:hypothetical protein
VIILLSGRPKKSSTRFGTSASASGNERRKRSSRASGVRIEAKEGSPSKGMWSAKVKVWSRFGKPISM